jgi:hypothetical protein
MKSFSILAACLCYIGTVDYIEGDFARVEIRSQEGVYGADIPVIMFPCDLAEGSLFYIDTVDGVTEIRCGEPDV